MSLAKHISKQKVDVRIDGIPAVIEGHLTPGCKGARDREVINGRSVAGRKIEPDDPATFSVHHIYNRKGSLADFLKRKLEDDRIREDVELQIGEEIGFGYVIEY